ncbi:MAG: hypothetical protein ACKESB_03260 [Candidatus Hodgkinia cicadicola]
MIPTTLNITSFTPSAVNTRFYAPPALTETSTKTTISSTLTVAALEAVSFDCKSFKPTVLSAYSTSSLNRRSGTSAFLPTPLSLSIFSVKATEWANGRVEVTVRWPRRTDAGRYVLRRGSTGREKSEEGRAVGFDSKLLTYIGLLVCDISAEKRKGG